MKSKLRYVIISGTAVKRLRKLNIMEQTKKRESTFEVLDYKC